MRSINKNFTKEQVCDALSETGGVINDAIRLLGISRGEFFRTYRYDPEIEAYIKQLHKQGFEEVTDVLYKQCLSGNIKAINTYLKYNPEAKAANWTEEKNINITELKPLTDEEKSKLVKELF